MSDHSPDSHPEGTELRRVEVADPRLTPETNAHLSAQLREVIGEDSVQVPADRPRPSHGQVSTGRAERAFGTSGALMGAIAFFVAITVAAIVLTAIEDSFWFLALAMVLDIAGIVVIATTVLRMTSVNERPDAVTVADLQSEGIENPERYFSEVVAEFRKSDSDAGEHRETAVEDDHAQAAEEQRSAMTPTSGPSKAVGPGSS